MDSLATPTSLLRAATGLREWCDRMFRHRVSGVSPVLRLPLTGHRACREVLEKPQTPRSAGSSSTCQRRSRLPGQPSALPVRTGSPTKQTGHSQCSLSSRCASSAGVILVILLASGCGGRQADSPAASTRQVQGLRRADGRHGAARHRVGPDHRPRTRPGSKSGADMPEVPFVLGADHPDHRQRIDPPAAAVLRSQHSAGHTNAESKAVHNCAAGGRRHHHGSVPMADRQRRTVLSQRHWDG